MAPFLVGGGGVFIERSLQRTYQPSNIEIALQQLSHEDKTETKHKQPSTFQNNTAPPPLAIIFSINRSPFGWRRVAFSSKELNIATTTINYKEIAP
jgi:hypothetical protein